MPALPMTQILFTRNMTRTRQDGVQFPITVNFGTPSIAQNMTGAASTTYYCPFQFTGTQDNRTYVDYGEDMLEALSMAICHAGSLLGMSPYASTINGLNVAGNFGFPALVIPPRHPIVSGTVQMELCNDPAQNITFEFRTRDGKPPTIIHQVLTPVSADTGSFSIPGVPNGTYDVAIKAFCWLRRVIPGVVVAGADVSGLSVSLIGGDINNDNIVDSTDFGGLIGDYGLRGDP